MSNPEQESCETKSLSENPTVETIDENSTLSSIEKTVENLTINENVCSSEITNTDTLNTSTEPSVRTRMSMPQDIRYSTEQSDREKLMEKYSNYQVSDINACNIRFLTDNKQKRNFLGRNEEEKSSLNALSKAFNVNILPGYQNPTKHGFKIFGTEAAVRKCVIAIMNQMFKHLNRSTDRHENETNDQQTGTPTTEKYNDTELSTETENTDKESLEHPTSVSAPNSNVDSSINEEKQSTSITESNKNEEKLQTKDSNSEQEQLKFVPLERKPEYTFTILITSQGQEVLKKNWSFFAGSLQQRLKVTVTNPLKLQKFGDNQWQNELSINGETYENITDAALQIIAFINDVLRVPVQPYIDDEQKIADYHNNQRTKYNNNTNDYHQQRSQEHNVGYRQSSNQYPAQSSPYSNYHERTYFNRGRHGAFEVTILIRSNCTPRIVGTRGSNLRRIQAKCHLRDIFVARHPNENGYVECTLSAYQSRNLNFAIETIRSYLKNEDDQAVLVPDSHHVDTPLQASAYQNSPHLSMKNQNLEHGHQHNVMITSYQQQQEQQQSLSSNASNDSSQKPNDSGFMTRTFHLNNSAQMPKPSYNFQNTPSFDFTHQPTSALRKTDKRPGEANDFTSTTNFQGRSSNDNQYQQQTGSSSSNSSSTSPRHKSKRTCPETKEIDCTTDDGFWIQKQYYHALDDASKELFDSLLDKLEKIRIASEENAVRKQQRLVGRARPNKSRLFTSSISSITQANDDAHLNKKSTKETKTEESTNSDEKDETKDVSTNEQDTTAVIADEK